MINLVAEYHNLIKFSFEFTNFLAIAFSSLFLNFVAQILMLSNVLMIIKKRNKLLLFKYLDASSIFGKELGLRIHRINH